MPFTRQGNFSTDVTKLPDVPSPSFTPTQIKDTIQNPSKELKDTVNKLMDDLEANTGADTIGAKDIDNNVSTVQAELTKSNSGLKSHKTATILDHPDKSVTEPKLADKSVSRRTIQSGAVGVNEIDPSIMNQPTTAVGVQAKFDSIDAQLADIMYLGKYINQRLKSGSPVTIKVIGDSYTAGVGSTGYYDTPATQPDLIFVDPIDGTTEYRESNYTNLGWANLFRNYILNNYSNATYKKWGIGGKSAKWWNARIKQVTTSEDIVFVMLGTNDRWDCLTTDEFKTELTGLLEYLKGVSNALVVMSPSPVTIDSDSQSNINFGQQEVNRIIHEVCVEKGLPLISHYDNTMDYCYKERLDFNTLMYTDGTHPNDNGYKSIWRYVQYKLRLYDFSSFLDTSSLDLRIVKSEANNSHLSTDTPSNFRKGFIIYNTVTSGNTSGFPENSPGILVTDMTQGLDGFVYQLYHLYNVNKTYRRCWGTNQSWGQWEIVNSVVNISANDAYTNASVPTDFPVNRVTNTPVTSVNATGFPKNRAGLLITDRSSSSTTYNYQYYKLYSSNFIYMRTWLGSAWSDWVQMASINPLESLTLSVGSLNANEVKDFTLAPTQTINQAFLPLISIVTAIPSGVMYSTFMNPTGNLITLRFHNTTAASVSVGNLTVKFTQVTTF